MRKLSVLFLVLLSIYILAIGQSNPRWQWLNPLPQGNRINDVCFSSTLVAFCVGSSGTIMLTTDAGETWKVRHNVEYFSGDLNGVAFADENIGLAVGDSGVVLRTINGGLTWQRSKIGFDALRDVQFSSVDTAIAISLSGVYRTTNRGTNWMLVYQCTLGFTSIAFANSLIAIITGYSGVIYRTSDAGTSWTGSPVASRYAEYYATSFANNSTGFTVGFLNGGDTTDRGPICLRTTDAGMSWETRSFRRDIATLTVVALDSMRLVGTDFDHRILRSTNGGLTWRPQQLLGIRYAMLSAIQFGSSQIGLGVGDYGLVIRATDGGATWLPKSRSLERLNYFIWGSSFSDSLTGTVVSDYGETHRTTNAGLTWIRQTIDTTVRALIDVDFFDSSFGFTVGSGGTILGTGDAGVHWSRYASGTVEWLSAVHVTNRNTINIVGEGGGFVRSTNRGINWNYNKIGDNVFSSVEFADSLTGIITGWFGMIFKTTDGGETWSLESQGQSTWFYDVTFVDKNTVVVVGSAGVVLRSTDSGETWVRISTSTESYLHAVKFYNRRLGLAVGEGGAVLHTKDGGLGWQRIQIATSNELSSISFLTPGSAIVTGEGGTILRLDFDAPLAVNEPISNELLNNAELHQNYPNPFNPLTVIHFSLPYSTFVKLVVFDILGREIQTLVNEQRSAGYHSIEWKPESLSSGIYFYQLQTPSASLTRKLLLLR